MYSIDALAPSNGLGAHGFNIHLSPKFHKLVSLSGIDQQKADRVIQTFGPEWLLSTGHRYYFDPENCGWERQEYRIPSDRTRLSEMIRIQWGEWGLEHISVPGNACGLDIDEGFGCVYPEGKMLLPHNIDSWNQKMLLLLIFTWFAHSIQLHATVEGYNYEE